LVFLEKIQGRILNFSAHCGFQKAAFIASISTWNPAGIFLQKHLYAVTCLILYIGRVTPRISATVQYPCRVE